MALNYIKKYLSKTDLDELKDEIGKIESETSGEIRLCLKLKRGFHERKLAHRELALKEFFKLEMNKTVDKTGVLIFLLFEEKKFEIIADEGINSKIHQDIWDLIINHIKTEFSNGNYKTGLTKCLNEIGKILIKEFPVKQGDKNELPDDIVIE
ncbi:MAG: TPM domain-containing protein [Ignavibacteriae bacterium]|nr:TPM domain-containing protein [Ignavibacteriota bacterium]